MRILKEWRTDKLKTALVISWMLTVFSSFLESAVTLVSLPAIGAIYPFRLFLPITAALYLVWAAREKRDPWKDGSNIQRVCYILCALLLVHSGVSLFFAIDRTFTFRRLFNLCFDLCFFWLALALCKDRGILIKTIRCVLAVLLLQIPVGIYEVFFGGVLDPIYDTDRRRFTFFTGKFQRPVVASGNTNDFSMMLVFMLAVALLYWAWRHREEVCDWIPVAMIAPIYFLIRAGDARLCFAAFCVLSAGFVLYTLTLKANKRWILILTALLMAFVIFGQNYQKLVPQTDKTKIYREEPTVVSLKAVTDIDERIVSLADRFLKDEMFIVDEETGQTKINLQYSAGARLDLLLHAAQCVVQSKGMGVGLGNTEQLAKAGAENRRDGVWNIHCFLARMAGDFGVFFIIPFLILAYMLIRKSLKAFISGIREKKWGNAMLWVLYLTALITYPIASTAPSDAQDCLAMWLFLAIMMLLPTHFKETQQN